jgi:hypothetical protein
MKNEKTVEIKTISICSFISNNNSNKFNNKNTIAYISVPRRRPWRARVAAGRAERKSGRGRRGCGASRWRRRGREPGGWRDPWRRLGGWEKLGKIDGEDRGRLMVTVRRDGEQRLSQGGSEPLAGEALSEGGDTQSGRQSSGFRIWVDGQSDERGRLKIGASVEELIRVSGLSSVEND